MVSQGQLEMLFTLKQTVGETFEDNGSANIFGKGLGSAICY